MENVYLNKVTHIYLNLLPSCVTIDHLFVSRHLITLSFKDI